jgi:hypothetical protein
MSDQGFPKERPAESKSDYNLSKYLVLGGLFFGFSAVFYLAYFLFIISFDSFSTEIGYDILGSFAFSAIIAALLTLSLYTFWEHRKPRNTVFAVFAILLVLFIFFVPLLPSTQNLSVYCNYPPAGSFNFAGTYHVPVKQLNSIGQAVTGAGLVYNAYYTVEGVPNQWPVDGFQFMAENIFLFGTFQPPSSMC